MGKPRFYCHFSFHYRNRVNFRMKQFLIAIDQVFNAIFGGFADETLSARSFRLRNKDWSWQYRWINRLFFWQLDHCKEAFMSEIKRMHLPVEYR